MKFYVLFFIVAFTSHGGGLDDFIEWQDYSLLYIWGDGYKINPNNQHTISLEHVSKTSFGNTYFFTDFTRYNHSDEPEGLYGEATVRFSYNKIFNKDFRFGPIKDLLLATSQEFGKGPVETFLIGPAVDLDLPGFDYFQLNLYNRIPVASDDISRGWQLTPVWGMTIPVGRSEIVFDGFVDWVFYSGNDNHENYIHANPELKYNIGKAFFRKDLRLYVGVGWDYWSNKYGIKDGQGRDSDQNVLSLLVKYHF